MHNAARRLLGEANSEGISLAEAYRSGTNDDTSRSAIDASGFERAEALGDAPGISLRA